MASPVLNNDWMIPVQSGQAVTRGWARGAPRGITWHWPVAERNITVARTIGGPRAERKGVASAHCSIGRTYADGIWFFVGLENASWHAGKFQTLNVFGEPVSSPAEKGSRDTYGIEVCSMGASYVPKAGWFPAADQLGNPIWCQPWTEEGLEMCIKVALEVVKRFPHIRPEHHHGHYDICPVQTDGKVYKIDPIGFPFARVLRGVYAQEDIYDHWTPTLTVIQRQRALVAAGMDLGLSGPRRDGADGAWGRRSREALIAFQRSRRLAANGCWNTFTSRELARVLRGKGMDLARVTAD